MTGSIKEPHTTLFTGTAGCGKTHLVLDFFEKEYVKHFDYTIIISMEQDISFHGLDQK